MLGNPLKAALLTNFAPQVARGLSQPARATKLSPSAIARTGASKRVSSSGMDLMDQGAPAFAAAIPILSQLLKAEMAEREVRSSAYHMKAARFPA